MRLTPLLGALLLLGLAGPARAGQVEDQVRTALTAIQDGDFDEARRILQEAEDTAAGSSSVVTASSLASIHFYRGVLEYYDGDRAQKTLDHWRLALLADQDYAFDRSLVADQEPQDLFEALRSEVRSRPHTSAGVAEDSDVRVFVDGRLLKDYDMIVTGRHLVQVLCPDDRLIGAWHEYGEAPDYYAACSGEPMVAETAPEGPERPPKPPREPLDIHLGRVAALGAGGVLLAGGVVTNFALVEPAWDRIEDARAAPATVTRAEADALTSDFNLYRFTTLGLLTLGAAGLTTGLLIEDGGLHLVPGGLGVHGRF